ncbi:DUF305 domain-containing protein [Mycobacterium sp. PS03-16]|uniref:DUF305 domain-containing protein n=1 Tax=Mycobacterium sp. PS03-16 TaxID=2559611 RepID=UPI00107390C4|nr:DUF305 domain-containing protein [Mycobacterium sp. PS03-16]TFV57661.1 DUF305 domain-containing protein [Mycobacterium sp. PS03-16]
MMSRLAALIAASATALLLSSCSDAAEQPPAAEGHANHTQSQSAGDAQAAHNADDVAFAQGMIPHHQQAIELADLARERSTDPALLDLASAIAAAQGPEVDQMTQMLRSWGEEPMMEHGGHGGHDMSMQGMVDAPTMQRLGTLSGAEFDTLWLQSMIAHHQGAVEMAKAELANGQNAEAKTLAEAIITAQEKEIAQMNEMLAR